MDVVVVQCKTEKLIPVNKSARKSLLAVFLHEVYETEFTANSLLGIRTRRALRLASRYDTTQLDTSCDGHQDATSDWMGSSRWP